MEATTFASHFWTLLDVKYSIFATFGALPILHNFPFAPHATALFRKTAANHETDSKLPSENMSSARCFTNLRHALPKTSLTTLQRLAPTPPSTCCLTPQKSQYLLKHTLPTRSSQQIRYLACTAPQSRQRLRAQRASASQPKHSSGKDLPSDRSIPYTSIMIVVEGQGITGPHRTEDVLNGLNLATHTLRLVSAKPQGPRDQVLAVCKVFNRAEEAERKANEEAVRLEKEKLSAKQKYKIVEIGWAIADNDLALKAKRLKEFLESGYKVEVVLKGKRHGRKATSEEAEDVLRRVREAWAEVPGAREARTPDGEVGKMMRMFVEKQG